MRFVKKITNHRGLLFSLLLVIFLIANVIFIRSGSELYGQILGLSMRYFILVRPFVLYSAYFILIIIFILCLYNKFKHVKINIVSLKLALGICYLIISLRVISLIFGLIFQFAFGNILELYLGPALSFTNITNVIVSLLMIFANVLLAKYARSFLRTKSVNMILPFVSGLILIEILSTLLPIFIFMMVPVD